MTSIVMFYVISAFILIGGFMAIASRKIFRSAVWLLFSLTGIAALYFWLDLQFLAAVQIIVYIGGIVVLIIFSIFLTEHTGADLPAAIGWRKIVSAFLALSGFLTVCYVLSRNVFIRSSQDFDAGISVIGRNMLNTGDNGFALPFEAVSVLLLAAMIGCISIALKKNPEKS